MSDKLTIANKCNEYVSNIGPANQISKPVNKYYKDYLYIRHDCIHISRNKQYGHSKRY